MVNTRRSLTLALVLLAAVFLPSTPAYATYGAPISVQVEVYNNLGAKLSGIYGSVSFDDGNSKFAYSLAVCRESSYTPPNVWYAVNGGSRIPISGGGSPVTIPQCKYTAYQISGEPTSGTLLASVTFTVDGVYFDNHNVAHFFSESRNYFNPSTTLP
jgi:hypothetical protein